MSKTVYVLRGWRYYDGFTEIFVFSSPSAREQGQKEIEENRPYEHEWDLLDLQIDEKEFLYPVPRG